MDLAAFKGEAINIAKRNVNDHVVRVYAGFDADKSSLRIVYCTENEPTEEDWEYCELTCAEMIAAFPEFTFAETDCRSIENCHADDLYLVFSRL